MKILLTILSLGIFYGNLISQDHYTASCKELVTLAYKDNFNFEKIESKLKEVKEALRTTTKEKLKNCNCADSIWVAELNDVRRFASYTHTEKKDTNSFLRMLSTILDKSILIQEFKFEHLANISDSLSFVINRIEQKAERRHNPKYNWMNFYHCIEAETEFLKLNKYRLKDRYFQIFDNTENSEDLRDNFITSYFYSNPSIEDDILKRIVYYIDQRYFYRMLGILRTSGTDKSINFLIDLLKEKEFELNNKKSILQSIYGIADRTTLKRKTKKRFNRFLEESKLNTLSRYDLYIRKN